MKTNKLNFIIMLFVLLSIFSTEKIAQETTLEDYILSYKYDSRKEMKINSKELVILLKQNKAQLIDIRFEEEYKSWNMPIAISIPISNLPNNLLKLDKRKIIVTACPHKDRAIIAMTYLRTKGYKVKYLSDGLLGLADYLRGDNAKKFIKK